MHYNLSFIIRIHLTPLKYPKVFYKKNWMEKFIDYEK